MINKELILEAKKNGRVLFFKGLVPETPGWNTFHNVYKESMKQGSEEYGFCTTLTIDNSESLTKDFDPMVELFQSVHPGTKIAVLSINHFLSANDNSIPEEAREFAEQFVENNPNKLPSGFDLNLLQPSRHSDPVDGFFVQCNGKTTWRVFYDSHTDVFETEPGDALYIPKNVDHSVETMTVRSSISISFYD